MEKFHSFDRSARREGEITTVVADTYGISMSK
jgi:hypothetical protein